MGFTNNNFCFKIKYFKFEDGLSLFALSKLNARQTVSLHLKRRDNCEKIVRHALHQDILEYMYLVSIWDCVKSSLFKQLNYLYFV